MPTATSSSATREPSAAHRGRLLDVTVIEENSVEDPDEPRMPGYMFFVFTA